MLIVRSHAQSHHGGARCCSGTKMLRLLRPTWKMTCASWPQAPTAAGARKAGVGGHQCRQHRHLGHAPAQRAGPPGLSIEVITDDQDFTHEWLREARCWAASPRSTRRCAAARMEALGLMDYVAVGEPTMAQHMPQGLSAHQFAQIPFIAFNRKDDMQRGLWPRPSGCAGSRSKLNCLCRHQAECGPCWPGGA